MVEPSPLREFVVWPLHITIVPWFPAEDEEKLDSLLTKIASSHEAFIVEVGKSELFGRKDKLTVNLVKDSGSLHRLHWEVFHTLEKNGFSIHQKTHMAEKYKPYITHQGKKHSREGEELIISSFTLVRQVRLKKTGTMIKEVVKEYSLQ